MENKPTIKINLDFERNNTKLITMKTWLSAPTKKQVIIICSITAFLFLRLLVTSEFLSSNKFSNRQYLIFGILMAFGFVLSTAAILLYRAKKTEKGN